MIGNNDMNGRNELMMNHEPAVVEAYDEMLDEIYGDVNIAGHQYSTSRALSEVDPIAYRVGFSDYLDMLEEDDDDDD